MRNLSVKAKLLISGALSIFSVVVLMALSFYSANQSGKALASIYENEVQPMTTLMTIDADLKEIRFRMAGVLVDQMPFVGSKNHLSEVKEHIPKQWGAYKADIRDKVLGKEETELIAKIEKKMADLPVFFDKLSAAYAVSDKKQVGSLLEDEWPTIQGGLIKPLGQLVPLAQTSVKTTYEGSIASGKKVLWVQIVVGLVCLGLIAFFAIEQIMSMSRATAKLEQALARVAEGDLATRADVAQRNEFGRMADSLNRTIGKLRDTVAGVKDAANSVAAAASELLSESDDVLKRADSQTDSIMQVSAAMEQTTVAANEVAHSADNVEQAAASAQGMAAEGNQHMSRSADASRRIVDAVGSSANTIAGLSQSIDRVGEITRVIKEIADQTNLLALNAAIEAARAGEQGRGFAVVADEVRKLAERTATSTTDITNMIQPIKGATEQVVDAIQKIQQEVTSGNEYNSSAENSLSRIVESANRVTEMARQIAGAVKEQSSASQDVARQLERISSLSEENNVSIANVDEAAKGMARTAGQMQQLVNHFRVA